MKGYIVKGLSALGIVAVSVTASYFVLKDRKKIAYVDLNKVFQKFEFKENLEKQLLKTTELRTQKLDSLEFELNILSKQIESENAKDAEKVGLFQAKRDFYFKKKQEFEEDRSAQVQQYDEQILKQLTQYVNDYGKDHDYTYILGSDGNGMIMYSEAQNDITEEVIVYINNKFKGIQ
jgi:outer membrane protein